VSHQQIQEALIAEPRSSIDVVTLTGGYLDDDGVLHTEVVLEELRMRQEDILGNDDIPWAKRTDLVLADVVVRLGSVPRAQIPDAVKKLHSSDRDHLYFALRRRSLGDIMPLKEACPHCEKTEIHQVDLRGIEPKPVPNPMQREYPYTLPSSGLQVVLRPMTGETEHIRDKYRDKLGFLSLGVFIHIASLGGKPPTIDAVLNLVARDRDFIRGCLKGIDGTLDTSVELECRHCHRTFKRTISPNTPGFFFPSDV
jgi:hypothetical protein